MKSIRIVIFAKAPRPGFAKTRLIPELGAQGAAKLARRMLIDAVTKALAANIGTVELCVTPSITDFAWPTLGIPDAVQWSQQAQGDLGRRMGYAAQRVIGVGDSILLIGTDCPALSSTHMQQAAKSLEHADATLLPTFDGGYALLGLNRYHHDVFSNIAWSTNTVASETLCRLKQLNWTVSVCQKLHDIDEPDDLKWLPNGWLMSL